MIHKYKKQIYTETCIFYAMHSHVFSCTKYYIAHAYFNSESMEILYHINITGPRNLFLDEQIIVK